VSKLRVRRANPEELMDIADIVLDSFVSEINGNIKELEGSDVTNKDKFYNFYVNRALSKIPFVIYIAEINDKVVGVAGGSITMHHWGNELWGHEDFWFVKKEHRGSKAGIMLFNKLMEWFKNNNAKRIQMTHYTWNPGIKDFYKKQGFKPFEVCYVYKVGE
jgi:GNAT superfamily N-acetyltransferase